MQENKKLRGKYTSEQMNNELNVFKTLFKMDPQQYGQTMKDLQLNEDKYPIWSDLNFLDRGQEQVDPNNTK